MTTKFIQITTLKQLMEWWWFFEEGLAALNDRQGANMQATSEEFFTAVLHSCVDTRGNCVVATSKNDKPIGFGVAFESTPFYEKTQKIVWIYAVYSKPQAKSCLYDMMTYCENWARSYGATRIMASTGRITGAALRWFEGKHKFRRRYIVFQKEVD